MFSHAAVVTVTLVVMTALAEATLRIVDFPRSDFSPWVAQPATGYGYAPLVDTRFRRSGEFDIAFATNRDGLRDDEIVPKSGRRIVLLGDSFASGYGVERGEIFADILERQLHVDVVNAAVGGYELIHQVRYYESRGRHLDPDVVLYTIYLANDLTRNEQWHEAEDGSLRAVGHRTPVRDGRASKLLLLLDRALYRQRLSRDDTRDEWEPFPDYVRICEREPSDDTRRQWRLVEQLLGRLDDLVVGSNARLVVASFSHRTANDPNARARYLARHPNLEARYDFSLARERIGEITQRLGIVRVDVDGAIAEHYAQGGAPLYFPRDGHWNTAGHRVAAAALVDPLRAALDGNVGRGTPNG